MANPDESGGETLLEEGYARALAFLRECATDHGFLASTTAHANYHRIWGRDSCVIGLAALRTGDAELVDTCRQSLETLLQNQGPHGEIPSNVDPNTGRVSYGGTVGRVDSNLWFVICACEYYLATHDDGFLDRALPAIERVRHLLGAWEFNTRGLLYVPLTGDWADEYIHNGYVLFDQLLYYQAQRLIARMHREIQASADHNLLDSAARLKRLIRCNYWFWDCEDDAEDIYHEVMYAKSKRAARHVEHRYWLPFFWPAGYGYRFDALANVLVSLFGIANDAQREEVDRYITEEAVGGFKLLPAFHPVIKAKHEDWEDLQMTYAYEFKNKPHEYHNGGRWPFVTAFHVADLARRGHRETATQFLEGIHRANRMGDEGEAWGFYEYLHGETFRPMGTPHMGWSAAAGVLAARALDGEAVFSCP